jgi:RNA polymerase sigma-B factor
MSPADALDACRRIVLSLARRFAGHGVEVEDLEQEARLSVVLAARSWPGGSSFESFAYVCVQRRMLRLIHEARRHRCGELDEELVGRPASQERTVLARIALARLAPDDREVVALRAEGYTMDEIGERLQVGRASAQRRTAWAIAELEAVA